MVGKWWNSDGRAMGVLGESSGGKVMGQQYIGEGYECIEYKVRE